MSSTTELEISADQALDIAEERTCKEICSKADYIDSLIDQFLDESPYKALALVSRLEAAAHEFIDEDLARQFEV